MTHKAMESAGRKNSRNSITAFAPRPDIHISIEEMVSEGDLVVGYYKIKATYAGAGFGMESTGKPAAFEGMLMFRVQVGRVVEAWNCFDFLRMVQQMGVVKMAGG